MSIAQAAQTAYVKLQLLAAPVTGGPEAPAGAQAPANQVWHYLLWGVAIIGSFALACVAVTAYSNYQQGRSNDAVARGGLVIAGVITAGLAASIIGTLTGT